MTSSLLIRIASAFILIAGFANLTLSIPYGGHFWNFAGLFIGMVEIIVAVKGIRTSLVNRKKEAREFYYYMIGLVVGIIVIEIFNAAYMLGRGLENYCDSASYTNEQCEVSVDEREKNEKNQKKRQIEIFKEEKRCGINNKQINIENINKKGF